MYFFPTTVMYVKEKDWLRLNKDRTLRTMAMHLLIRVAASVVSCTEFRVGCYFPEAERAIGGIRNHSVQGNNKACRDWKVVNSIASMITAVRFLGAP